MIDPAFPDELKTTPAGCGEALLTLLDREQPQSGHVYIVGTPIGNLADLSPRALGILSKVDLIAAEDTRHTGELARYFGFRNKLISYHEHNAQERGPYLIELVKAGKSLALVTDAGMPAISDPGQPLVDACLQAGIPVHTVPGPSALVTALALSGLDSSRFCYFGFLPVKGKERQEALTQVGKQSITTLLYEAPHRLTRTLQDLVQVGLAQRTLAACRELTKQYEEVRRGTVAEILQYFKEVEPRGEFVLILAGPTPEEKTVQKEQNQQSLVEDLCRGLAEGKSTKDLLNEFGQSSGMSRNDLKRLIQDLKTKGTHA